MVVTLIEYAPSELREVEARFPMKSLQVTVPLINGLPELATPEMVCDGATLPPEEELVPPPQPAKSSKTGPNTPTKKE